MTPFWVLDPRSWKFLDVLLENNAVVHNQCNKKAHFRGLMYCGMNQNFDASLNFLNNLQIAS